MNIDKINFERVFYNTLYIGWSFIIGFLFALYMVDAEQYNNDRRTVIDIENTVNNWKTDTISREDFTLIIRGLSLIHI